MSWYMARLYKVGITACKPLSVIREALLIGSGNAIDTAIGVCISGISEYAQMSGLETQDRRQLIREFMNLPEVLEARKKLNQIKHEAI